MNSITYKVIHLNKGYGIFIEISKYINFTPRSKQYSKVITILLTHDNNVFKLQNIYYIKRLKLYY